ncbi:MAG: LysM peptidoglycan-binding domain-containing protein, partial [Chloroflexota bacterium]
APMQSFFFRGGIGRPECTDAPSTLAIQSDEDVTIDLTVNGLDISLGSLVTLTSPSRSVITLTLHEGTLTTGFPARVVSAGEAIDVTLDENRVFRSVTAPRPATMEELALAVPVTQAIDAVEGTLIASGPVRPPGGSGAGTYTVQRGDNMFRIALNNGTCVSELARTNNIPASQVRSIPVGTVLTLPDGSTCGPFVNDVPVGAVSLPGPFSGGTASGTTPAQTGNETTTTQATDEASTSGEATTTTTDDTGRDTTGETTTTTTTDDTGRDTTTDNTGRDTTGDDTTTGTTTMDDNTIPGTTIIIPGNLFGGDDSDN